MARLSYGMAEPVGISGYDHRSQRNSALLEGIPKTPPDES
jgi:hypothetical protein